MIKKELLSVLELWKIAPKKSKGQNFLIDQNLLKSFIQKMDIKAKENILEIGPGLGALTELFLKNNATVYAVEYDQRIYEYLTEHIKSSNFNLFFGDACKVDFSQLFDLSTPYRCLTNLPYAISTIFIMKIICLKFPPREMFLLIQKEMAMRVIASINTKQYSPLSIVSQLMYDIKIELSVPPSVFHPQPRVDSLFISFKNKKNFLEAIHVLKFKNFLRNCFRMRRKTLLNNLKGKVNINKISIVLEKLSLKKNIRAEQISPEQYLEIFKQF